MVPFCQKLVYVPTPRTIVSAWLQFCKVSRLTQGCLQFYYVLEFSCLHALTTFAFELLYLRPATASQSGSVYPLRLNSPSLVPQILCSFMLMFIQPSPAAMDPC